MPAAVHDIARGRPVATAWINEVGGVTFEVGRDPDRVFVKWAPSGSGLDLAAEADRLAWAAAYSTVPVVLTVGANRDGTWLVTRALPGRSAVSARWLAEPDTAVRAIGAGLRTLHDALPARACPFTWSAAERVADARRRAVAGHLDPTIWHDVHQGLTIDAALAVLGELPPTDRLVVCHGDSCAPNTLLTDDGRWSGHVDLGSLGVADPWADLAVATWSTEWNYGPGFEGTLLDAYGIAPDPDRTRYYRLLWDLGP